MDLSETCNAELRKSVLNLNSAIKHVRDFFHHNERFTNSGTSSEALFSLNRTLSLLSTSVQPQYLVPNSIEISKFYVLFYDLIRVLNLESDVWSCIELLQNYSRNPVICKALVYDFRFIPLLTNIFKGTQAQEKISRILVLLQDLTYGITIQWEEPYISILIILLVDLIYKEEEVSLALSILVNLCNNNFKVILLFHQLVDISTFSRKIDCERYGGVLASKMLIILSEGAGLPEKRETEKIIRSFMKSVDKCLEMSNVILLRHIVDFLMDSNSQSTLQEAMLEYQKFSDDISRFMKIIDLKKNTELSTDDERCLSLLFRLISHILQLNTECIKNSTSFDSIFNQIYNLASDLIKSEAACIEAMNLLEHILTLSKNRSIDTELIERLIKISVGEGTSSHQTVAILQFILNRFEESENTIISAISESYYDKIFAKLLATEDEFLLTNSTIFTTADTEKFILGLLLLIKFSKISKEPYLSKSTSLLKKTQFQITIARVIVDGSEMACKALFDISKHKDFPRKEVSSYISQLNRNKTLIATSQQKLFPKSNEIFHINRSTFITKESEERINTVIQMLLEADRNHKIKNVAISELIQLYNHKNEMLNKSKIDTNNRLEDACNEITKLSHQICLQKAELENYTAKNMKLSTLEESLDTKCKNLTYKRNCLKVNITTLMKKLSEQSESIEINEKRLEVLSADLKVLRKEHATLTEQLKSKKDEVERLQNSTRDNVTRIEKLKKTIIAYEADINDKSKILEEKEFNLAKITKKFEEQKEAKRKSDDIIRHLETQIKEQNEKIHEFEIEINETEETRKIILSLMESKKSKR